MPPPSAIPRRRSMMASSKTNIVAAASSSSPSSLGARFESPRINRHRCALLERSASEIRKRSGRGESDRRPMVTAAAVSAAASTSPSASSPPPPPPPPPSSPDTDLVVVGAGASGLAAALAAHRRGNSVLVLEASGSVGGRVQTDVMTAPASSTPEGGGKGDSFLLDRGFQIFLTSYPTAKELLDYAELDLRPFYAGAAVRFDDRWSAVADPFRHPADALATLLPSHPIGSPLDKLRVGLLRAGLLLKTPRDADAPSLLLRGGEETTTLEALRNFGFSEEMVDRFFRPFLGGIFFDNELKTSSRLFEFVMRSLATGANCLPAEGGIGSVTRQMASKLPSGCIRLNSRVVGVEPSSVGSSAACAVLADGTRVRGRLGVVVATERDAAEELLGAASPLLTVAPSKQGKGVGTCCAYFDAPVAPLGGAPMLMLNGELLAGKGGGGRRPRAGWKGATVNNATCLSSVAPSYAPAGRHLISVSTVGTAEDFDEAALVEAMREQLDGWCGRKSLPEGSSSSRSASSSSASASASPLDPNNAVDVSDWRHLRTYRIPFAQPPQSPPTDFERAVSLGRGLFVAGDHRGAATLEGALAVGVRAADEAARRGGR